MPSTTAVSPTTNHNLKSPHINKKESAWNGRDVALSSQNQDSISSLTSAMSALSIQDDVHLMKTILPPPLQAIVIDYIDIPDSIINLLQERKEIPDYFKNYAKSVKHLDLSNHTLTDKETYELIIYFDNIESLKIIHFFPMKEIFGTPNRFVFFKSSLQKLERLDMSGTKNRGLPLMFLFNRVANQIKHLNLSHSLLSNGAINTLLIMTSKNLTHLNINHCLDVNDNTIAKIKDIASLRHLEIEGCSNITSVGFMSLPEILNLEYLNAGGFTLDNDHGLGISRCKNLKNLNLSKCVILESCLLHIGQIETLAHLDISGCDVGGNKIRLLHSLKNLRTLNAYNTTLTQNEINEIIQAIPGLVVNYSVINEKAVSTNRKFVLVNNVVGRAINFFLRDRNT